MSESPNIYPGTQDNFAELVLQNPRRVPVLVDFWADWCQPCHMLMPILSKLVDEYAGAFILVKVNSDEQQALATQFGIRSLPTVKVFKNGEIVDEFMGVQSESVIREILERHIERESDRILLDARVALERGDSEQAAALVNKAADLDPSNPQVKIEQAKILMGTGEPERAEIVLDDLRGDQRELLEVRTLKARLAFARIATQGPERARLEEMVSSDPDDLRARYQLSAAKVVGGDFEGALNELLEIMKRDRGFDDDAGRKGLLTVFEILGGSGELVSRYRALMSNALH
jgi:putative thioredoxin